jgi:hypothetical protein
MTRHMHRLPGFLVIMVALIIAATGPQAWAADPFAEARIFFEYNSSDNDLGVHVFLDAEDWKTVKIVHPNGSTIFEVTVRGGFKKFGLSELFFEGAEPSLDEADVLEELLELFPEKNYKFIGSTVDGTVLQSTAKLSHAIPAGPEVSAEVDDGEVTIRWKAVTKPPEGFPNRPIKIAGYQVIVGSFQVTLPASSRSVEVPEEYIKSLEPGTYGFEVLAIEASGNQTITAGSFTIN